MVREAMNKRNSVIASIVLILLAVGAIPAVMTMYHFCRLDTLVLYTISIHGFVLHLPTVLVLYMVPFTAYKVYVVYQRFSSPLPMENDLFTVWGHGFTVLGVDVKTRDLLLTMQTVDLAFDINTLVYVCNGAHTSLFWTLGWGLTTLSSAYVPLSYWRGRIPY